ncbi:hypothetical protein KME73_02435 [Latilactobacillus curvatus]|uniref:hypothetical protein n=1 Tax=Latilactobacillus curvatus TaxID=28038 RepID=UPI001BFFFF78|nr:hypothetical protein [Latilactobacillus curvatus]QWF36064.1 hypothetical protein KME73_02435 [Latilactobacillus curvatus]
MDLLFIFLILENIFERFLPILSYTDEVIALICLGLLVIKLPRARIHRYYLKILLWFLGVLLIGLFSTFIYLVQTNPIAILKDMLAVSKFFIVYIYSAVFMSERNADRIVRHINIFSKIYIPVLFVFSVVNQFFNIGMDSGYRGPIKTFAFLYSHSTFMVASVVVVCSLLIAQGFRKNLNILICIAIVLAFSMRSKAFIYMASILILMVLIRKQGEVNTVIIFTPRIRRRIYISIIVIAISAYFIARAKIRSYLAWGLGAARPALYIIGFKILRDFFPLGSGFASFASSISGAYYSPLYFKYGINNVSGLRQSEGYEYMSDTFWPYIIAQFGVLGTVMYILALLYVFKDIIRMYKKDASSLLAAIALFIYIIAGCFVESMLTNATIVLVALTLGYYLRIIAHTSSINHVVEK